MYFLSSAVDINSITSTKEANELALSLNKDPKLVQLILNESQSIIKLDLERGIIITENKIPNDKLKNFEFIYLFSVFLKFC